MLDMKNLFGKTPNLILKELLSNNSNAIAFGALLIFVQSILILPVPFLTKYIIDTIIIEKRINDLFIVIALIVALLIILHLISFEYKLLFFKLNSKTIISIKKKLINKIFKVEKNVRDKNQKGYLLSRIDNDCEQLRSFLIDTVINILKDVLTFLVGIIAIFFIHWKLALLSVSLIPFYAVISIYYSKKIREKAKVTFEDRAQMTKQLEQSLSLHQLSSVFNMRLFPVIKFYNKMKILFRSSLELTKISAKHGMFAGFLTGLAPILVIGYGGYEIIQGRLTLGSLIAFNSFVGYLFGPTSRLINVNVQIQQALVALKRVEELFNLPEEEYDKNYVIPNEIADYELRSVSFAYEENKPIFEDLNLKFEQNKKIALVGGSGCGKTTIINLLLGLYNPDKGDIFLNREVLTPGQVVALRKTIALVEQEPMLINESIYENIRFGNMRASKEEIIKAAQRAHADEFITELEKGYQTMIENNGGNLSVGQKQRIAIARALVRNPKILILDEATSNIDPLSEKYIMDTIYSLPQGMIVIIVAHRLSTVRNCDEIIVLENGKILERGTHEELIIKSGKYFEMMNINEHRINGHLLLEEEFADSLHEQATENYLDRKCLSEATDSL